MNDLDASQAWIATRAEAIRRLERFLPNAGRRYAASRNFDRGPGDRDNVSVLSPYIRRRMITEEEVVRAVRAEHSASASEKYVQEVMWRTYWKGWLEQRPGMWASYLSDLADLRAELALHGDLRDAYRRAIAGSSGIAGFDDWSRELAATGYLHNHARMWFASIWTFTLRLPWQLGADFFLRHLLDGDPASNTLSWRWVAGLHTRGKTYTATRENIRRYTDGRFDPGTGLAGYSDAIQETRKDSGLQNLVLPGPPGSGPTLLLLHEEDLGVETFSLDNAEVRGVAGALVGSGRSERVEHFAASAVADALTRAGERYAVPSADIDLRDKEAIPSLLRAAHESGATSILTAYAPLGPVRAALDAMEKPLAEAGMPLVRFARPWDGRLWPFARSGYFAFKDKFGATIG